MGCTVIHSKNPAFQSKMLVLTKEKVKVREGKTTNVKEPYSDNVNITLSTSDDLR